MKKERIISVLVVLAVLLVTSCSKIEPLNEKKAECCESSSNDMQVNALMINDNEGESGSSGITDPDHDGDHDKDDSSESKEQ